MKYRELTPQEQEAYQVGYKVGNRKLVITDIEWESEQEHKIYRKGYMAGLMDFKRKVSNVDKVNDVSKVSNVDIETSITPMTSTTPIGISIRKGIGNKDIKDSKGGMGEKKGNAVDEFGQKVKSLWNDVATKWKLEKIRVMTPARIRQTKDLLKQLDMSLEDFFGQLDYEIEVSPLLRGRTLADDGIWEDATWKCSFGFLVEPRQKKPTGGICIIEGRYRDPDIVRGLEKKKQMAIDAQKGERDGN